MSLSKDEIINALEDAECYDGFSCPFGMYGQNKEGEWGCFAKQPNGDPKEENQGCIAHQAARLLKAEKNTLAKGIKTLELSKRAENCLHYRGVYTIGQLVNLTEEQLWKTRNVGKKVVCEIKDALAELGLSLKEFPDTLEGK